MGNINLEAFGHGFAQLDAREISRHEAEGEPVLLFEEVHSSVEGIDQSVCNARALVDAGIVGLIGVEGYVGDIRTLRHGDRIADRANFAMKVALAIPNVVVWGVEDQAANLAAGIALEVLRSPKFVAEVLAEVLSRKPPPTLLKTAVESLTAQRREELLYQVGPARTPHLVRNFLHLRATRQMDRAAILNVGRAHHDDIEAALRKEGVSYIRLRPNALL